jgi:ketosteroid isomerase-like protein
MALTKAEVREVVERYVRAWVEQDPDLILTVFTESATYCERVFEKPICSHKGIRQYWQEKVVESQARIECRLLNLYLDGCTAIAEWEACFDDLKQGARKRMREVAILEFEGRLIQNLREYWASQAIEPDQDQTEDRSDSSVV